MTGPKVVRGWAQYQGESRVLGDWLKVRTVESEAMVSSWYPVVVCPAEKWEKMVADNDRLRADRADILNVTTTDGMTASEWVLRTAKAEARAKGMISREAVREAIEGIVLDAIEAAAVAEGFGAFRNTDWSIDAKAIVDRHVRRLASLGMEET